MLPWVVVLGAGYFLNNWLKIQAAKVIVDSQRSPKAMMGFSLKKSLKKAGKGLKKSAKSVDWNQAAKMAVTYGPMIASVNPAAAPFVQAGMALNNAAQAGDPAAVAKVEAIQAGAAAGNPDAKASLDALKVAQLVAAKAQEQQATMGLWC